MTDNRSKIDFGVIAGLSLWLIALSFWSGVSFMQIQSNTNMIEKQELSKEKMWDAINDMRDDLRTIAGYIKGKDSRDP
jgi:CHASE3 domain sensor protein